LVCIFQAKIKNPTYIPKHVSVRAAVSHKTFGALEAVAVSAYRLSDGSLGYLGKEWSENNREREINRMKG